ncbi:hypothetical protein ACTXGQ_10535 [Marinobacter sp. 1Y8]
MERYLRRWREAAFAFALWGGWACAANWQAGPLKAVVSGVLQGSASFVITLLMAAAVEWQVGRFRRPFSRIFLPPLFTVIVTGSFLFIVHTVGQTPQLWTTILPPMMIAFFYCLFLSATLTRTAQRAEC